MQTYHKTVHGVAFTVRLYTLDEFPYIKSRTLLRPHGAADSIQWNSES